MKALLLTIFLSLFLSGPAFSATIQVGGDLELEIPVPEGWTLYQEEPPMALVEEMAEHIAHEAEAQGASPSREQILDVARKRLVANEAILYHDAGGAHLDIDFSALDPGQKPPSTKTLRNSAKYAAQSLAGEEGVSDVDWEVSEFKVQGAREAFLLAADYRHHDDPVRFLGVIGFAGSDQWFFLYYTDYLRAPGTFGQMQEILDQAVIRATGN